MKVTNPKGSGRKRSKLREDLKDVNLINLLNHMTLVEIAEMFNTSICLINAEVTERFSKSNIGFSDDASNYIGEDDIGLGAWDELKNTELYKQIMKNKRYEN
jgi:hypothetical protein